MANCWSIEVLDTVVMPAHWQEDGRVFVDMDEESELTEEIDQIRLIKGGLNLIDGTFSVKVPYTERNHLLFRGKVDVHIVDQEFTSYKVQVVANGVLQGYNYLSVESKNDASASYKITLTDQKENPLLLAEGKRLCDITFGDTSNIWGVGVFTLSKEGIEAQFANNSYTDGDPGYFWGFAWYGKLFYEGRFTAQDLRPWYSPLYLLREGFKSIGYKFDSAVLETPLFRKAWAYLSDNKYGGNSSESLDRYKFLVQNTSGNTLGVLTDGQGSARDFPLTEVYDNVDGFDITRNIYEFPAHMDMEIVIEYDIDVSNADRNSKVSMQFIYAETEISALLDPIVYTGSAGKGLKVLVDATFDLSVDEQDRYVGRVSGVATRFENYGASLDQVFIPRGWPVITGDDGVIINKLKIYNRPIRKRYGDNQFIHMGDPIDCDINLYDLLKGMQHLVGGYIDIDLNNNKVSLEIPYDADLFGATVEGYLNEEETQDLSHAIMSTSQALSVPKKTQARYKKVGFKKSTDAYIKSILEYDADNNPYDKAIDLGDEYKESTEKIRNPLFEPTLLNEVVEASQDYPVHLPMLLDSRNEPGEEASHSYDIGPRICLSTPMVTQLYTDSDGVWIGTVGLNWYNEVLNEFPFFFNSMVDKNFTITPTVDEKLVYGDEDDDLWSIVLSAHLTSEILSQIVKFQIYFNPSEMALFIRYNAIAIQYGYEYIFGFMKSLRYNHCTGRGSLTMSVPIERHVINSGVIVATDLRQNCEANQPTLLFSRTGSNDVFTLGGSSVSVVTNVVFKKQEANAITGYIKGEAWVSLTNTTSISTNQPIQNTPKYRVSMQVSYDDCDDQIRTILVDECAHFIGVTLQSVFELLGKKPRVRINLNESVLIGSVTSITCTVSVNGAATAYYSIHIGTLVGPYVDIDFDVADNFIIQTLVIDFDNGCQYTLPNPLAETIDSYEKNAGVVESATITCQQVSFGGGGRYIPVLSNVMLSKEPSATIIMYRNDNTDVFGEVWNSVGVGPVGDNPEFQALFIFDDGQVGVPWVSC